MLQGKFKQAAWQIPLLIAISGFVAVGINHWRSDGIALVGNWSVEARFSDAAGDSLVVTLEEAALFFEKGTALFLDARLQDEFDQGHIQGALSLPWQEAERYLIEIAHRLEGVAMIITYCDGESCDLSHELALFLKEMGFANVRVLVNGWRVWQQAGLPIAVRE